MNFECCVNLVHTSTYLPIYLRTWRLAWLTRFMYCITHSIGMVGFSGAGCIEKSRCSLAFDSGRWITHWSLAWEGA